MCKSVNIFVFRSYQCCPGALNYIRSLVAQVVTAYCILSSGNFRVIMNIYIKVYGGHHKHLLTQEVKEGVTPPAPARYGHVRTPLGIKFMVKNTVQGFVTVIRILFFRCLAILKQTWFHLYCYCKICIYLVGLRETSTFPTKKQQPFFCYC